MIRRPPRSARFASATLFPSPDSATASLTLHCTDGAGNDGSDTAHFQYDGTAPTVVVFFNDTATSEICSLSLHDALPISSANGPSGAGSCDADSTYSTPDSATASLTLHCTDGAGNDRSEERRVGKEGRSRWAAYH